MSFVLDPRLQSGSRHLAHLTLSEARLQDDARFPWIVLVPRRPALMEITDLAAADRDRLWAELGEAGKAVHAVGSALGYPVLKLNHGQLGNVVAQLHVHIVGRHPADAAWPGPVWGAGVAEPYGAEALERALAAGRRALSG